MTSIPEEQDFEIIALVEKLQKAPERFPQDMAAGKARFLAEAQSFARPVFRAPERHPNPSKTIFSWKAQPVLAILAVLITIFVLVFGGTGVTVYAAQSSLPGQPLYGVKLASEDVRVSLPASRQTRIGLAMDLADLRLQEAQQLAAKGKPIPGTVWTRMENHIDLGLYTAAGLDDNQLAQQLLQIQARLNTELGKLVLLKADPRYSSTTQSSWAVLLNRQQLVTMGLIDPAAFRKVMLSGNPRSGTPPAITAVPSPTSTDTPEPARPIPTITATAQPQRPASTPAVQATETRWPSMTPWSQNTPQPGWHTGPTPAPTHQWDNHDCHDCCQNCGNWDGGSGGHSGGDGGGSGGGHR